MTVRYKFNLVTYDQRPLVEERRGGTVKSLNEITAGIDNGRRQLREESSRTRVRCE